MPRRPGPLRPGRPHCKMRKWGSAPGAALYGGRHETYGGWNQASGMRDPRRRPRQRRGVRPALLRRWLRRRLDGAPRRAHRQTRRRAQGRESLSLRRRRRGLGRGGLRQNAGRNRRRRRSHLQCRLGRLGQCRGGQGRGPRAVVAHQHARPFSRRPAGDPGDETKRAGDDHRRRRDRLAPRRSRHCGVRAEQDGAARAR